MHDPLFEGSRAETEYQDVWAKERVEPHAPGARALAERSELPVTDSTPPDPQHQAFLNLLQVCTNLAAELDSSELLKKMMEQIVLALPNVEGGIIWLYDRRAGKMQMGAAGGLPINASTCAALAECQISPGETLAGQVFQHNEYIHVESKTGYLKLAMPATAQNKALLQTMLDQLPNSLSVYGVPLRVRQEVIGAVELMSFPTPSPHEPDEPGPVPSPDHILFPLSQQGIQTFADLVAVTIKNALLYEESQRQCRRLNAFDAVVTAISAAADLHDLMHNVLEVVLGLVPVSSGAILLYDPIQSRLTLGAHRGLPASYQAALASFPVAGAACEEVIHYGQPMIRPLMDERGEADLLAAGKESCAYLPLLAGGTVVGALGLYGDSRLHRQIDIGTLMPLSNQVGFAIANVRLYEASQLERQKLNTVINSTAEGVILCDSTGNLILANEAALALLSLDSIPFEQPLVDMADYYHIRDLEGMPLPIELLPMSRALAGEVFHDYRVIMHGASGSGTVMSFSGAPARAENSGTIEGAVVIFRDITANQKLERAKDEFLAVAAHELRSPLASVRSYADMLLKREQQRAETDSRDVRGLTILSQQVTHMLRMVDNLLDVSRLDAGRVELLLQPTNMVSLTAQVLDLKRPEAGKRDLVMETDQAEIMVQCDSMRIRQVLTNLVGNAIKYSPPETAVHVRLDIVESEQGKEVLVAVTDKGSGIAPEQRTRLFQRFYRAGGRRRTEGLGLGLYLSREFVQMHNGRIWNESTEGSGNTFFFTLPLVVSEETDKGA